MRPASEYMPKEATPTAKIWRFMRVLVVIALPLLTATPAADGRSRSDEPITPLPRIGAAGEEPKIALGRHLFFDRRLSSSGKTSCASCHDLATNGASARAIDRGDTGERLAFNTPTVFNAAYSYRLNWQGQPKSMEALVTGALHDDQLMGGGLLAIARLGDDPRVSAMYNQAFGRRPNLPDTVEATTAFMRTLVTPDAAFDRWLRGDRTALTSRQRQGYARFKALGCASCHQGVNLGGNLFQKSGIYAPLTRRSPKLLRVPSLRNVAVTSPYFHDGSAATLEVAVDRMGRAQLGVRLSQSDANDIAAFLRTLTGTYRGRPLAAPARKH